MTKETEKGKRRLVISSPLGQLGRRKEENLTKEGTQQQPGGTSKPAYIWAGCLFCLEGDRHMSSLEVWAWSIEQQRWAIIEPGGTDSRVTLFEVLPNTDRDSPR